MKKTQIFNLLVIIMLLGIQLINAQDIIVKTNRKEIKCKVIEVGLEEIKYKFANDSTSPTMVIAKMEVYKIKFENGQVMDFKADEYDVNQSVELRDYDKALKLDFFSPLLRHLTLGYEQKIKVGLNFEGKLGLIGLGIPNERRTNLIGFFINPGIKLVGKSSTYVESGKKRAHALAGGYIRPNFTFAYHHFDRRFDTYDVFNGEPYQSKAYRVNVYNYGLGVDFGFQSIVAGRFVTDFFFGLGYCYQTNNLEKIYRDAEQNNDYYGLIQPEYETYNHNYFTFGKKFPMTIRGGWMIGYLID
ncbi:MAG: hypothetical protein IPO27_02935 [Bacteroidetes bacterium]|nr:hypothetical protein [Bacteroidota bacterium]